MPDAAPPEPRTMSGRAWASGLRPHLRRAVAATIVAIEDEAAAPYADALDDARELLGDVTARTDLPTDLADRARALLERLELVAGGRHGA